MGSVNREIEGLRQQVAALAARVRQLETAVGLESPREPDVAAAPGAPPLASTEARATPANLESRIGSQWLNRIGIIALLVGVSYFLRYAFENDWVGPSGRVGLGLLAGTGVVLWSERFRASGYLAFSWSLKAVGIGTMYLSIWAGFQLYRLVPVHAAFAAMAAVTASTAVLALRQNASVLALLAMLGGYATPVLLSTGDNRPLELFLYLTILNAGILVMVRYRPWTPLLGVAFVGTAILYVGWHVSYYTAVSRPVALPFATIFFAMFAAAPLLLQPPRTLRSGEADVVAAAPSTMEAAVLLLLPLANAALFFLQLIALLEPIHNDLAPAAALILAAVHLALSHGARPGAAPMPGRRTLSLLYAGVAVAFVTIAIPLKLDGHWMTLGWLVQAGVLIWIARRAGSPPLARFGVVALGLAVLRLVLVDDFQTRLVLLNWRFLSFAVAVALLAAIAWHGRRGGTGARALAVTTIALNALALLALSREVDAYYRPSIVVLDGFHSPAVTAAARDFAYSAVWMAYGAVVMAAGFLLRWALLRWQALIIVGVTIGKVFIYDLSNLDQAYRILSFIALGLLLLSISFAYQRDWLRLREDDAREAPPA